jgi:hypothetical protein
MPATLYNCPTSQFDRTEINQVVNRQELARISATRTPSFDPVTLECHSEHCNGDTVFTINPGELVACPKCKSRSDAYRLGEWQNLMTPIPDVFDGAEYGDDILHLEDLPEPTSDELDEIEKETKEVDSNDLVRARICRKNNWDWNICKEIFGRALTPQLFQYLQTI